MTDIIAVDVLTEGLLFDEQGVDPQTGCPTVPTSRWDASLLTWPNEPDSEALHNRDLERGLDVLADPTADDTLDEMAAAWLAGDDAVLDDAPFEVIGGRKRFVAEGIIDLATRRDADSIELVRRDGPRYVPTFRGSRDDDLREQLAKLSYLDATDRHDIEAERELRAFVAEPRRDLDPDEVRQALEARTIYEIRALVRLLIQQGSALVRERRERWRGPVTRKRVAPWSLKQQPVPFKACSVTTYRKADGRQVDVLNPAVHELASAMVDATVAAGEASPKLIDGVPTSWPTVKVHPDAPRLERWVETQELRFAQGIALDHDRLLHLCRVGYWRTIDPSLQNRLERLAGQVAAERLAPYAQRTAGMFALTTVRQWQPRYDGACFAGNELAVRIVPAALTACRSRQPDRPFHGMGTAERQLIDRMRRYWLDNPDPAKRAWAQAKAEQVIRRYR